MFSAQRPPAPGEWHHPSPPSRAVGRRRSGDNRRLSQLVPRARPRDCRRRPRHNGHYVSRPGWLASPAGAGARWAVKSRPSPACRRAWPTHPIAPAGSPSPGPRQGENAPVMPPAVRAPVGASVRPSGTRPTPHRSVVPARRPQGLRGGDGPGRTQEGKRSEETPDDLRKAGGIPRQVSSNVRQKLG